MRVGFLFLQGGVGLIFVLLDAALLAAGCLVGVTLLAVGPDRLRGHTRGPAVVATVLIGIVAAVEVAQDLGAGYPLSKALSGAALGRAFVGIDRLSAFAIWPLLFGSLVWLDLAIVRIQEASQRSRRGKRS